MEICRCLTAEFGKVVERGGAGTSDWIREC